MVKASHKRSLEVTEGKTGGFIVTSVIGAAAGAVGSIATLLGLYATYKASKAMIKMPLTLAQFSYRLIKKRKAAKKLKKTIKPKSKPNKKRFTRRR